MSVHLFAHQKRSRLIKRVLTSFHTKKRVNRLEKRGGTLKKSGENTKIKQNESNKRRVKDCLLTGWLLIGAVCSGLLDPAQFSRSLGPTEAGKQPVLTRRSDAETQHSDPANQE